MATVEKYTNAAGDARYRVRYRAGGQQSRRNGFTTKAAATAWAAEIETDMMTGAYVAPSLGRITVAELAPAWLSRKESVSAPSHYRTLDAAWRTHVKPRWGRVAIADVDLIGVEAWLETMTRAGSGATTVIRAHGVLSGILADAVKGKRLSANPCKGVENLPRKTGKRHVYLTAADVARLADEAGQHRALVLTLAYTGVRWGEAIALRVRDVAFLRRRLTVAENAVQIGTDHATRPTKGRKARTVPVPDFVLTELSLQCAGKAPGDLVFSAADGGYLPRPKSSNGWFKRAVERAEVQPITPHDLRHTCASLAVSAGVNVLALQRMLGHTSAKMTLDTYSDLFDDDLDAVATALHARYGADSDETAERKVTTWCASARVQRACSAKVMRRSPASTSSDRRGNTHSIPASTSRSCRISSGGSPNTGTTVQRYERNRKTSSPPASNACVPPATTPG
jgi:integrase